MSDTELIIKIINAVKQRDCLWNVHSSEYAKRDKLERAWQEVADDVGRQDVFCREKWRNVRTGFLRSIQYNSNMCSDNNDSTEDLPTPRRKRFYLYDEMKFLLPSTETIGQTKKRRKLSRGIKAKTSYDDLPSGDCGDIAIQTHTAHEDTKQYSNTDVIQNTVGGKYIEILNELTTSTPIPLTRQSLVSATTTTTRQSDAALSMKINRQSPHLSTDNTTDEPNMHSTTLVGYTIDAKREIENSTTVSESFNCTAKRNECDNRDEQQLLAFFRGNIDDILSLPRYKQRLFKRRMLELIDDLHHPENGVSTNRYC
ncbi:uncharacterized protein LOC118747353 [Rhagoletis pomonella]|uniref:uncharacterized protein LOC118747353 n=1 Tax=Rhagoletis pomonella TaxID=28610 RepID=UPI00177DF59E|nr:uncharacterized protein LOC118747353 [Rhagoletis pomonella]